MSRFAHHHPEDWQRRLDDMVDRGDHEKTRQRERATPDAQAQAIGILEFAGLHRCHNAPADQPMFCGCAPGRCVREEGNHAG